MAAALRRVRDLIIDLADEADATDDGAVLLVDAARVSALVEWANALDLG